MDSGRLETVPQGPVHLDTVRSLHQTVVSLRTALELSKNELKNLKEKYQQHSHCLEYADVIEKLTVENHILRRKIIDYGGDENISDSKSIKLQVIYSPRSQTVDDLSSADVKCPVESIETSAEERNHLFCSSEKLNEITELKFKNPDQSNQDLSIILEDSSYNDEGNEEYSSVSNGVNQNQTDDPESQITSFYHKQDTKEKTSYQPCFKTKLELLSKFDVRIKVKSFKEGTIQSSTTSDTDSTIDEKKDSEKDPQDTKYHFEERKEHFEKIEDQLGNKININTISEENIKMAVPNEMETKNKSDKFDVQVRIISEENLTVQENIDRNRRKDTLNLDVDDLSLRSMSEGDNSVFSESVTPIEPSKMPTEDDKHVQDDNGSGNESEEVDDIELIFTTDESKDMSNLQEDLVSIKETDQWTPQSGSTTTHSTPVLIKFHTLDPDFQPGGSTKENNENDNRGIGLQQSKICEATLKQKRISLPSDKEIKNVAFASKSLDIPTRGILKSYDNKSDITLYKKSPNTSTRRLDSVDSLTADYKGLSFDNTKSSSFELGSSMDILHRDDSMDSFYKTAHLGHRFSVFAESDMSKCGISEDDLSGNLNLRRNTCPNPFQYRPSAYRGLSSTRGPLKASSVWNGPRTRPVLRDCVGPRRESGAQTDVCALPPRWTSDGYLAYKKMSAPSCGGVPTLPTRAPAQIRRPSAPSRPPPRAPIGDEARRVLLSDIGFTSMVPELSRSADPLWAMSRRLPQADPEAGTSHATKYIPPSTFRSPYLSRSTEWTPRSVYVPPPAAGYSSWRSSPDVRRSSPDVHHYDTDQLMKEADAFLRRSNDDLYHDFFDSADSGQWQDVSGNGGGGGGRSSAPYIPAEPRQLRLGHAAKIITPQGRIAVGRIRYVGLAGSSAATGRIVVGAEFPTAQNLGLQLNDGFYHNRRYFFTRPDYTALFVPFSKIVMAWPM